MFKKYFREQNLKNADCYILCTIILIVFNQLKKRAIEDQRMKMAYVEEVGL